MKKVELLDHTVETFEQATNSINFGNTRILITAGTGVGKSYIANNVLHYLMNEIGICGDIVVITTNNSTKTSISEILDLDNIDANISVVTYTYVCRKTTNLDFISKASIIIADEVHHIGSNNAKRIFDIISDSTYVLGLTQDPNRYSDKSCSSVLEFFQDIINGVTTFEAIEKGILNPLEYHIGLYRVKSSYLYEFSRKVYNSTLSDELLRELDLASSIDTLKSTLDKYLPKKCKGYIFVKDIDSIYETIDLFKSIYPNWNLIPISSRDKNYNSAISEFNSSESDFTFLVSVNVISEGHHYKDTNVAIFLRKNMSMQIYNQQLGRLFSAGSDNKVYVFDFVSNIATLSRVMNNYWDRKNMPSRINTGWSFSNDDNRIQYMVESQVYDVISKLRSIKYDEIMYRSYYSYNDDENQFILDNYGKLSNEEIAKELGRSINSVRVQARRLGVTRSANDWTDEELEILKDNYSKIGPKKLQELLPNRTRSAIVRKASLFGLIYNKPKDWESWEDDIIIARYPEEGTKICELLTDRTPKSVINRAKKLGVKFNDNSFKEWEDDIIRTYYPDGGTAKVLEFLPHRKSDRCRSIIKNRAKAIGVTSNKYISEEDKAIILEYYPKEGLSGCMKRLPHISSNTINGVKSRYGLKLINSTHWQEEEDKLIKDHFDIKNMDIILDLLPNRSKLAITQHARKLLGNLSQSLEWSETDISIIKEFYPLEGTKCKCRLNGSYTPSQVTYMAKKLSIQNGLSKSSRKWSNEEIEYLLENHTRYSIEEISEVLNRTKEAINQKLNDINIKRTNLWEDKEVEILKAKYPSNGSDIPELLERRTKEAIRVKANSLGLEKNWSAEELCVLAIDTKVLDIEGCIVTDQNAASLTVRFYDACKGIEVIDFEKVFADNWVHENTYETALHRKIKCAEILVPNSVPYDYIAGACVLDEKSKERLEDSGFDKDIIVKADTFFR